MLLWLQHPYTVTLARWLLAGVFLVAATGKLLDRQRFLQVVLAYKILPKRLASLFALLVPWIEGMLGTLLLLGLATQAAAILSALLLLCFIIGIGINLIRGRTELDCGCFGPRHRQKIGGKVVLRNIALLILSIQVSLFINGYLALDLLLFKAPISGTFPSVGNILLVIATVGGLVAMCILLRRILYLIKNDYRL